MNFIIKSEHSWLIFMIILCSNFIKSEGTPIPVGATNGGVTCAVCEVIVSLVDQLAEVHNETIVNATVRLCSYIPEEYQFICEDFFNTVGPILVELLSDKFNADVVCHALQLCSTVSPNPTCHLYQDRSGDLDGSIKKATQIVNQKHVDLKGRIRGTDRELGTLLTHSDICDVLPGFKKLCETLEGDLSDHLPVIDSDKDGFGIIQTLRGTSWRGKDCDEHNPSIHPGAKPIDSDRILDSNCNGISGVDPSTGKPYEDLFCSGTKPMGVVMLGDSAGAHFHIPPQWFTASELSVEVFEHMAFVLENEFDWPMMSYSTGYMNYSWPIVQGYTHSLYQKLRERNFCNHRDYQNIAANGVRSSSMNSTMVKSLSRNQTSDQPVIAIYSLIGNDVCNGHPDTVAHMTTTKEMSANAISTLQYLDKVLPSGSHVFITSMVDGRILWDALHDQIHPLGKLRNDIKYQDVYQFLSCLQISPCNGWMTANETLRNITSERAANLSNVLQGITKSHKFDHFKVYFQDFPIAKIVATWIKNGGKASDLIEPVDGFHPNSISHRLIADYLWDVLLKQYPEIIGKVNANNANIIKFFGNQGGYV